VGVGAGLEELFSHVSSLFWGRLRRRESRTYCFVDLFMHWDSALGREVSLMVAVATVGPTWSRRRGPGLSLAASRAECSEPISRVSEASPV